MKFLTVKLFLFVLVLKVIKHSVDYNSRIAVNNYQKCWYSLGDSKPQKRTCRLNWILNCFLKKNKNIWSNIKSCQFQLRFPIFNDFSVLENCLALAVRQCLWSTTANTLQDICCFNGSSLSFFIFHQTLTTRVVSRTSSSWEAVLELFQIILCYYANLNCKHFLGN